MKATITIKEGGPYKNGTKDYSNGKDLSGKMFTSVDFRSNEKPGHYGASSPCDTTEQVKNAIYHARKYCREHNLGFEVIDKRVQSGLLRWVQ